MTLKKTSNTKLIYLWCLNSASSLSIGPLGETFSGGNFTRILMTYFDNLCVKWHFGHVYHGLLATCPFSLISAGVCVSRLNQFAETVWGSNVMKLANELHVGIPSKGAMLFACCVAQGMDISQDDENPEALSRLFLLYAEKLLSCASSQTQFSYGICTYLWNWSESLVACSAPIACLAPSHCINSVCETKSAHQLLPTAVT